MPPLWQTRHPTDLDFTASEVTGAIGDSVTVLPIVVAVAVLTDLSLAGMLVWFGVFQVVWGGYYGVPISVEPMKALAGLVLAGSLTTGEYLMAGLVAGVALIAIGATGAIGRFERYLDEAVVRGIQLAVALVLLRTGVELGLGDPGLALAATALALVAIAIGQWNVTALLVLLAGAIYASVTNGGTLGVPNGGTLGLTTAIAIAPPNLPDLTTGALEATAAQLAMTVGNAAVATSLLLEDYFDRRISPDELATSMGAMNLAAVPLGGMPMCHGSGGVAGKYAFGARTAVANGVLGVVYVALGLGAVGLLAAYPEAMLGVILVLVALSLGKTGLQTDDYPIAVGVGVVGFVTNVGLGLVVGLVAARARSWWRATRQ